MLSGASRACIEWSLSVVYWGCCWHVAAASGLLRLVHGQIQLVESMLVHGESGRTSCMLVHYITIPTVLCAAKSSLDQKVTCARGSSNRL